jgi:C-3',4' desaturase CrtD
MVVSDFRRYDAIVIGAGVAGLTAAAALAHRDLRILIVERHNVPGGCASFYQRDGYRFDVGATLVGGFGPRGVHRLVNARLGIEVSPVPIEPSMVVHLPGETVVRYGDARWNAERLRAFGPEAEAFWRNQERIADLAWDFSTRFPALPVDVPSVGALARAFRPRHLPLLATVGRTVGSIMPAAPSPSLRAFVDAQLLITAQTDAAHADLAYGSTALDLAREGTFHLADGISTISVALARSIRRAGSSILYNRSVRTIETKGGRVAGVVLEDGTRLVSDRVVAAVPVQNVIAMCPPLRARLRPRIAALPQRWGAFVVYVGLPAGVVPADFASHHQVVHDVDAPLGEGNTAFLSLSGEDEPQRARRGGRAVTISTHTDVARWERAHRDGSEPALRARYARRLLDALDRVLPGASARAVLVEPATPLTFERYTGRARGLVGGLPQTPATASLGALAHRTPVRGLFLCGDTTFPGQSTVGATLSGLNAARAAAY